MTEPRLPPLPPDEHDDEVRELLSSVSVQGPASNIFTTLVRHPGLFRRWLPFGGKLLSGRIPARERELIILRTGWLCRAEYEWGQHVLLAKQVGISDDEIAMLKEGPLAERWSPFDTALLLAVDELHQDARIRDDLWQTLAARWDERQLIEFPMLVGHYHMVAFTLNAIGVQREDGVPGF